MSTGRTPDELATAAAELRVVVGQLLRRMRANETAELTLSQSAVLSRLSREGPDTSAALARAENVRPQSMGATLAALEERGFVGRSADPDDGRRIVYSLTPSGERTLAEVRSAKEGWLVQALAAMDPLDQETLLEGIALLRRLAEQ